MLCSPSYERLKVKKNVSFFPEHGGGMLGSDMGWPPCYLPHLRHGWWSGDHPYLRVIGVTPPPIYKGKRRTKSEKLTKKQFLTYFVNYLSIWLNFPRSSSNFLPLHIKIFKKSHQKPSLRSNSVFFSQKHLKQCLKNDHILIKNYIK